MLLLLLLRPQRQRPRPRSADGLLRNGVMADRRVLFVCVENAGRSLMAEAMFNANAPAGWVAESAGTRPASHPNPRTTDFLREIARELPPHQPRELTPELTDSADLVVTMGCLDDASCPARLKARPLRDWALDDPAKLDDDGFRRVRDQIARNVAVLVGELAERSAAPPAAGSP